MRPKRVALYLRVSTDGQTTENQRLELESVAAARGWSIADVYCDQGISGAKFGKARPELERLRKDAARRRFDLIMAWAIDRLGRSTHEVTGLMEEFDARGIGQFYLQQGIDTQTPAGRAMVQMAAVFGEFERSILRERVMAGLSRARQQGKQLGRPRIPAETEQAIRDELAKKTGVVKIAKSLGVGVSTVARIKKAAEVAAGITA